MKKWLPIIVLVVGFTIVVGTLTLPRNVPEDMQECLIWALGEDWKSLEMGDYPARWNERHGDLFELRLDDRVDEGQARMYEAWKKHKLK